MQLKTSKKNFIKKITDVVTQVVMQSFTSKRQVTYEPKTAERDSVYSKIETPLNVGVGLYLNQTTRSKKLIDMFSGLNLSISYDKVIDIKKDVANAILEKRDENNGVFIPSCLFPSQRPFFAIDNTDMKIDTPTGKRQFHGTAMAAFQQHIHGKTHPILQIQRKSRRRKADIIL